MPDVSEYDIGLLTAHHIAKTHSICIVAIGSAISNGTTAVYSCFPYWQTDTMNMFRYRVTSNFLLLKEHKVTS